MRKYLLSMVLILLMMLQTQHLYAKKIFPSDILGRDLVYPPPIGWAGHVGIATTDMMDYKGMSAFADQAIEILNEPPNIGQINSISNFKKRSNYWGSKYGVVSNPDQGYKVLVEANHQRWWVRKYTSDTDYRIGQGNPRTGAVTVTGIWRCDTYVWWAFYSQGIDLVPGHIIVPSKVFNAFPYGNDERFSPVVDAILNPDARTLDNVTAEELNEMQQEEFQMIMDDAPSKPPETYIAAAPNRRSEHSYYSEKLATNDSSQGLTSPLSVYMRFAYDDKLNDFKRGIMIDRITMRGTEPDLVPKLLKLYNETDNVEVKYRIISGLMSYNQVNLIDNPNSRDKALLRTFFFKLINETLSPTSSADVALGFIQTHSVDQIEKNLERIDAQLKVSAHHSSITTKYILVHKSKELQSIYIKSILDELREANSAELDDYFFGPLTIGYNGSGKDLLSPENTKLLVDYLKEVHYKYATKGINENSQTEPGHQITSADFISYLRPWGK